MEQVIQPDPIVKRLQTMPGVGKILGPVIALEIGDVHRFANAERLASSCGLVPRVFSSGSHTRLGGTSRFVNLYLKWAFVETANCAIRLRGSQYRHVRELFQRLQPAKGHGRAAVAVARHLAEAAFWMLTKEQDYRPPQAVRSAAAVTTEQSRTSPLSSTTGQRETRLASHDRWRSSSHRILFRRAASREVNAKPATKMLMPGATKARAHTWFLTKQLNERGDENEEKGDFR
jgi:hypothetical protein